MSQQTISGGGAFTKKNIDDANSNFDELYAGTAGGPVTVDGVQTLTNKTLTAPVLTTPTLGVASATSVNKVAITAPATSATLVVADGKTFTVNQTLTLTGTTGTTMTFPSTSATVARTDAANTFTGVQTMTSAALTTPVLAGTLTGTYTLGGTPTLASAAGVPYAAGVAAGYKVARVEMALDGSNPTPWATGLTTIIAATVSLKSTAAPGVGTSVLTCNINSTSVDVYAWKVTATGDCTLVASTGTETFYGIAIGT